MSMDPTKTRIPFNVSYKSAVEQGMYNIVTREGNNVTVYRWDMNDDQWPVLAVVKYPDGKELAVLRGKDGRECDDYDTEDDLFLVPRVKLTRFETAVMEIIGHAMGGDYLYPSGLLAFDDSNYEDIRDAATILLQVAREEIAKEKE